MRRGNQKEKTKKHVSNKRIEQAPEKQLKKMETSNLPDAKFKILVIRISINLEEV